MLFYQGLRDPIIGFFVVNLSHGHIFLPHFALLEDVLINALSVICSTCSLVASFLFFRKQSAAYSRIKDLLPDLCSSDFPHHRYIRYKSIVAGGNSFLGVI